MTSNSKNCPECNELFTGRVDKKYCSDQCRNTFNNRLNSNQSSVIRNTNRILKKNRRILERLNPTGKATASREKLLNLGFQFYYVTGLYVTKKGDTYFYCYEQGYIETGNNYYALVKRKKYVE